MIESFQADYVIICLQNDVLDKKPTIVKSQLDDLDLKQGLDYQVYKEDAIDTPTLLNCWNIKCCGKKKKKKEEIPQRFFFALKFTGQKIDDIAHHTKVKGDLDATNV